MNRPTDSDFDPESDPQAASRPCLTLFRADRLPAKPARGVSRRQAIKTTGAAALGGLASLMGLASGVPGKLLAQSGKQLRLGLDNFAVRAMKWKAPQLIDYAAKIGCDSLFITDLYAFDSFDEAHLSDLRKQAEDKGLQLYLGSWSICPTSTSFKDEWGTAEEHLSLGIRCAKALGSPAFRVILGTRKDRLTEGGIDARIADSVKVLKSRRSEAIDAGVKIAVENHAGDLHSLELVRLIEDAGRDYVGANMDSGNAVWCLEDPFVNLENLGPYAVTTSLRDTAVWISGNGVTAQWTAMGDGDVDWPKYFARFAELCPDCPVNIETISGGNMDLAFKTEDFMKSWPNGKPQGFDQFLAWARKGKARDPKSPPAGADKDQWQQTFQKEEIEKSIQYCRTLPQFAAS